MAAADHPSTPVSGEVTTPKVPCGECGQVGHAPECRVGAAIRAHNGGDRCPPHNFNIWRVCTTCGAGSGKPATPAADPTREEAELAAEMRIWPDVGAGGLAATDAAIRAQRAASPGEAGEDEDYTAAMQQLLDEGLSGPHHWIGTHVVRLRRRLSSQSEEIARLREERDQLEKMAGGLSADLTAFHRKVTAALDPEHHLCIRDDDFGGQYADPIEVITETRIALATAESQLAQLREAVDTLHDIVTKRPQVSKSELRAPGGFGLASYFERHAMWVRDLELSIDAARSPSPGDPT